MNISEYIKLKFFKYYNFLIKGKKTNLTALHFFLIKLLEFLKREVYNKFVFYQ